MKTRLCLITLAFLVGLIPMITVCSFPAVAQPSALAVETLPDFGLVLATYPWSIYPGTVTTHSIAITSTSTFTQSVVMELAGLPADVQGVFLPNPASRGSTAHLWLSTPLSTSAGTCPLTITGSAIILSVTASTDLYGGPRIYGSAVDIGPDEALPDLIVDKTVTPTAAFPGQVITYTLAFSNTGVGAATGVIITDLVSSPQFSVLSVKNSGAAITQTGDISYTWLVEDLPSGQGGLITITAALTDPLAAGVFTNAATGSADLDDNPTNDTSFAPVRVLARGTGPGGVGATDGVSSLALWLRADAGLAESGGAVSAWADQSGHGLDMTQGTAVSQPTLIVGALNGQPALSFDGSDDYVASATLADGSLPVEEATVFIVSLADNSTQYSNLYAANPLQPNRFSAHVPWGGRIFFDMGACCGSKARISTPYDAGWVGAFHVWGYRAEAGLGKAIYRNGASIISDTNGTSSFITQTHYNLTLGYHYAGDMAELVIYNTALISAERILVENYLSARYNIALDVGSGARDVYAGDEGTHSDYDLDVAGIGQEADGASSEGHSAGLVIQESGDSLDDGEYVVVGHKVAANGTTTAGTPPYVAQRWERAWYVDKTATNGVDVRLAFDFDQGGLGEVPSGDYVLLYSAGTPLSFSDTGLAAEVRGDQVRFSVPDAVLQDGYYALGIVLPSSLMPVISPGARTIYQGQSALYTVTVNATPGLTQPAMLAAEGLDDAIVALRPNPLPLEEAAVLLVTTTLDTAPGTHIFTVTACSHGLTHTIQATLTVLPAGTVLTVSPTTHIVNKGEIAGYLVSFTTTPGITWPAALQISNLPAGVAYSFIPSVISPGNSAVLFVTTTVSTPPGIYQFVITSLAGSFARPVYAVLGVRTGDLYGGVAWVQAHPVHLPPVRELHALAYDDERERTVLFGGGSVDINLGDTWEWDGTDWVQFFPTTSPSIRWSHVVAYDSVRKRTVLACGFDGGWPNDTWEWNGVNWIQRLSTGAPGGTGRAMVYDRKRGRVVVFGGFTNRYMDDTWEWDGNTWVQRSPAISPPARAHQAMAYDSARGYTVLFGGYDSSGGLNDTWEWDGVSWEQRFPSTSPPARAHHAMAYDEVRNVVVLFGGSNRDDTWEWDGHTWVEQRTVAVPSARRVHAMAYDASRKSVVLFGGRDIDGVLLNETWEYKLSYNLLVFPITRTVVPGQAAAFAMLAEGASPLTFTISALPPGVTSQFYPSVIITPLLPSVLVLTTSSTTPEGVYPITLTGQENGQSATATITLTVAKLDFRLSLYPALQTIYPATFITYNVMLSASTIFTAPVTLSVSGLPAGIESAFSSNPALPNSTVGLQLTAALSATPGIYSLVIAGSATILSGTMPVPLTRTATTTLIVLPSTITPTISPGVSIYQGQSTAYTIMVQATPGLTQPAALAIDGLDDMTATFWPNPVPLGQATTLAITTTLDTAPGTRPFTVTVSSHTIARAIQPALLVLPAALAPSVAPSSRTIYQEQVATYTITVEATPGFTLPVTLAVDNLDGLAHTFSSNPILPGEAATLVLTTTMSPMSGSRVFTITASSRGLSSTTQAELIVLPASIVPGVSPGSRIVYQGQSTTYTVRVTGTPGLVGGALMNASDLEDASFAFWPGSLLLGESGTLAVTTTLGTAPGVRVLTVTAMTGKLISVAHTTLNVLPAGISLGLSPASHTAYSGQGARYTVSLDATPGFTLPAALEAGGLPDGVSHAFGSLMIAPGNSTTLLVTPSASTPLGVYLFTVTGTAAGLVQVSQASLEVRAGVYLPLIVKRWPPVPYLPSLNAIQGADDGEYTVSWAETPMRLADTYMLQEATDAAFTTGLRDVCTTAQQSCTVSGRLAGVYYYRVRGYNTWGYGGWSNVQAATVLLPDTPVLNPINNADGDGSYTVAWNAAARAPGYVLEEGADSSFSSPTVIPMGAQLSWAASGKVAGTYYYRVRAVSLTGPSPWSDVQSVTVLPPDTPVLNSIDNADGDGDYTVTWNAAARATSYVLEEDTNLAFNNPTSVYSGPGRSWSATGKVRGIYQYRVRATGPTGQSGWSSTQSATVTLLPTGVIVLDNHTTYKSYPTSSYRRVVGEVYNNTSSYLGYVKITVNFFNGSQLVETDYTYIHLGNLHPYEKTCFLALVNDPPNWTHYTLESPVYSTDGTARPNLSITTHNGQISPGGSYYRVIGQARNDEQVKISYVTVLATLYDATEHVIGCDYGYVSSTDLNPGQVSSFDVLADSSDPSAVSSYALQTDGNR